MITYMNSLIDEFSLGNIKILWANKNDHKEVETQLEIIDFPGVVVLKREGDELIVGKMAQFN